jgi:hypothetical protein
MREFSVSGAGITLANAAASLVAIMPAAAPAMNLEFLRFWVGQSANATSAQQRVSVVSKASTLQSTMTSATPAKLKRADAVSVIAGNATISAGTAGIHISTITEGAGAVTDIIPDAFNVLNGWLHVPTPAEAIVFPAGSAAALTLYLPVAAATLTNWTFGLNFREV